MHLLIARDKFSKDELAERKERSEELVRDIERFRGIGRETERETERDTGREKESERGRDEARQQKPLERGPER